MRVAWTEALRGAREYARAHLDALPKSLRGFVIDEEQPLEWETVQTVAKWLQSRPVEGRPSARTFVFWFFFFAHPRSPDAIYAHELLSGSKLVFPVQPSHVKVRRPAVPSRANVSAFFSLFVSSSRQNSLSALSNCSANRTSETIMHWLRTLTLTHRASVVLLFLLCSAHF